MEQTKEAVTSYIVALGTLLCANVDTIVAWGGLVLLIVRLIADVPRAYNTLFKKDKRID